MMEQKNIGDHVLVKSTNSEKVFRVFIHTYYDLYIGVFVYGKKGYFEFVPNTDFYRRLWSPFILNQINTELEEINKSWKIYMNLCEMSS